MAILEFDIPSKTRFSIPEISNFAHIDKIDDGLGALKVE
jgi:hypothetical protein